MTESDPLAAHLAEALTAARSTPRVMICEHCGWVLPADCTCRPATNRVTAMQLRKAVADRHRQAVARARASGWAVAARQARTRRAAA
ncbi:hypothetical protein ACQEVB_12435 [Pseudonocardia sp. CA-107938]|uniref:hypothetical protein n=1 Tax=Pseudonocardia sp. CA-107938 TaxID=3240021 RepID=UPI003D9486CF